MHMHDDILTLKWGNGEMGKSGTHEMWKRNGDGEMEKWGNQEHTKCGSEMEKCGRQESPEALNR